METRPGVPQDRGNDLEFDRPRSKRDPVHREGSSVPQNGGNRPPTIETRVMFIGRGVAYRKTGLHGILFISIVDPLQPPRATVHSPSTSSSLHLRLFIHELQFIQPPPHATPPASVQPALPTGSCSTTPPRATVHPTPTGNCSSKPPQQCSLFIQRQHRSASVSSSSEGIARSVTVYSHRSIARVQ